MEKRIRQILHDEFLYLDECSTGAGVHDRIDEVVQIYARIFNMDMYKAHDELLSGEAVKNG